MRPVHSVGHLAVALLSLSSTVSALAWPRWLPDVDSLVVRQNNNGDTTSTLKSTQTSSTTRRPVTTDLNTAGKDFPTGSVSKNSTAKPTTTQRPMFNPVDPAANVVMVTPHITDGSQLYKISDHITWAWTYSNLQGTPTAVDVLVSCSAARQTWTLTQNMTFATRGSYTWDTDQFSKDNVKTPLPVAQYTLMIHDSDSQISDPPEAGYLSTFTGFVFGLYEKRPYSDIDEWTCATCSAGISSMERRALGGVVAMSAITVLSFTWFVGGFGAAL